VKNNLYASKYFIIYIARPGPEDILPISPGLAGGDQSRQNAIWLIKGSKDQSLRRAGLDAGRKPTGVYPMRTKGAFFYRAFLVFFICVSLVIVKVIREIFFGIIHLESAEWTGSRTWMAIAAETLPVIYF